MVLYAYTQAPGSSIPRPLVPVALRYACKCGAPAGHITTLLGLVDTGATATTLTADLLPPHVRWADLPRVGTGLRIGNAEPREVRVWPMVDVTVERRRIGELIYVAEPGTRVGYMVLGAGLLERFDVAFMMGSDPPAFALRPLGIPMPDGLPVPSLPFGITDVRPEDVAHHFTPTTADAKALPPGPPWDLATPPWIATTESGKRDPVWDLAGLPPELQQAAAELGPPPEPARVLPPVTGRRRLVASHARSNGRGGR